MTEFEEKMKVVISRPIPGNPEELIQAAGHEVVVCDEDRPVDRFNGFLEHADGVITLLSDSIDSAILVKAQKLRVISNYAVGVNNIDLESCAKAGIPVTNTPDVLTDATADLTMTLILMTMRRAIEAATYLAVGKFDGWKPSLLLGRDLKNKFLGILGMGRIGFAVARRAEGFGMKILYHTKSGPKTGLPYKFLPFDELIRESDVLSLHLPLTPKSNRLIGLNELKMMKKGSVLINTARGPIVDEGALVQVLKEKHLFGAGLDVFENEPVVHKGLMDCPNAVLLPHIGSATVETRSEMGKMAAKSLVQGLAGEKPSNTVNPDVFCSPTWLNREKKPEK